MTFAFLDGPSAAGKTTLAMAVCELAPEINFVPRLTTRLPRPGAPESEYIFIGRERFDELKKKGDFVEYRDYDFGMSYGLPRTPIDDALSAGRDALAIVNLGRAKQVRATYPSCLAILIHVTQDELRRRLERRGVHTEDQIAERLMNAAASDPSDPVYDLVVENSGDVSEAAEQILKAIWDRSNA